MAGIDPLSAVQAGIGVIQTVGGLIGQGKAKRRMAKLQSQRQEYKTPDEVYQILQATQANASQGLGSEVLAYLTGNNNRALSSGLNVAALNGGDPNSLGSLFDNFSQQSSSIGAQNTAARLANFSQYLGAVSNLGKSLDAEWQSQDNMLKDAMQAASAQGGQGTLNLQGGLNAILNAGASNQMMNLYNDQNNPQPSGSNFTGAGRTYGNLPLANTPVPQINSPTIRPRS